MGITLLMKIVVHVLEQILVINSIVHESYCCQVDISLILTLLVYDAGAALVTGCDPICKRPSTIGYDYTNEDSNNCLFKNGNSNACKKVYHATGMLDYQM